MDRIAIRKDTYFDSVFLMAVSAELGKNQALVAGYVALATRANVQLLEEQGFDPVELADLSPTDLITALRAEDGETLDLAAARVEELLTAESSAGDTGPGASVRPVGLDGGLRSLPGANLALISVPGAYAAFEARKALERGLHVMLFSNNVSLEDEISLKRRSRELGLLVMGPDCGTSLIQGKPLGFANQIRPGPIGLVGASGTGLQEVSCQIHRLGGGVSHILGTGGRDLKEGVGALTTLAALDMLAQDPDTRILVVVSKPPARSVADLVFEHLRELDLPSVVCFLGDEEREGAGKVHVAPSLSEAAWLAHCLATGQSIATTQPFYTVWQDLARWTQPMSEEQRYIHGLFTGGTLGGEALLMMKFELGEIFSNLDDDRPAPPPGDGHSLLDLGDDRFTRGKPHPMIDPAPRCEQIVKVGSDPTTAVLLLDMVLGAGCHQDPAGAAAAAIARARDKNPGLAVVSSITGTDLDRQGLVQQQNKLKAVGAQVVQSNVAACTLAVRIIRELEDH